MSYILTISGSSREASSNYLLLDALGQLSEHTFKSSIALKHLPLFYLEEGRETPSEIIDWKKEIADARAVIIATPEYIHNIPGQLKSALDWLAASGELVGKNVLAISYTPHAPRGAKAMISLLQCLQALDANIIASLELDKSMIKVEDGIIHGDEEVINVLQDAINKL